MKKVFMVTAISLMCGATVLISGCHSQEEASNPEEVAPRVDLLDSTKEVQSAINKQAEQALGSLTAGERERAIPLDPGKEQEGHMSLDLEFRGE